MSQTKFEANNNASILMDVRVGQSLMIGNTRITVEKKAGQLARLRVEAERDIVVLRPTMGIVANPM